MATAQKKKAVQFDAAEEESEQNIQREADKMGRKDESIQSEEASESEAPFALAQQNSAEKSMAEESFTYQSQKNKIKKSNETLTLVDNAGTRSHAEYVKDVYDQSKAINANLNSRMPVDEINLQFNPKQQATMQESIKNLFDLLKIKNKDKLDVTNLKAYFNHQNVQMHSPILFKKVNDLASSQDFQGEIDETEFKDLFLNDNLLPMNIEKARQPPSLEEIAQMFEFMDEDRTGMISSKDLMVYLEIAERLKTAQFELKAFKDQKTNVNPALSAKIQLMQREVEDLVAAFDLTGDQLISPEEFFNIIVYAYS